MRSTLKPSLLAAAVLLSACGGAAQAPAAPPAASTGGYPPADRPVAEIVSPIWNDPARRDRADESGQLVRALGIGPGMTVADVGAGSGYHTTRLSPVVGPSGRVLAQDVNGAYLDDLRRTVAPLANVTVIAGTPDDPKLPPRSTDIALLVHMYHEVASPYAFMARLAGAMRPGGQVAVVDLDRPTHLHGTPPALLRCELESVGYRQTAFRVLDGDIGYVATFAPPAEPPAPGSVVPCRNPDRG